MPDVHLIAAVGRRGQLGLGGKIPWHDPGDFSWFKAATMGNIVIVGWKTANMMPDLPGRYVVIDNAEMTPEAVIDLADWKDKTIFIAGGEKTYRRYMHLVRRAYITRIDYDGPADTWMPPLWGSRHGIETDDLERTFDMRWQADQRAIKRWQAETGRTDTWPDHADLCVWLMEKLDAERERCRKIAEDVMLEAARATPNEMNSVIEATARTIAASIRLDP